MTPTTRRRFLRTATAATIAAPAILRRSYRVFAQSEKHYPERVVRLMKESVVIDLLHQFLYRTDQRDLLNRWLDQPSTFTEADFQRFHATGLSAIGFGQGAQSFAEAERLFARYNNFILSHPQWFLRIDSTADFARAKETGRYGILFNLQSSAQFAQPDDVDALHGMGLRCSQLSYNFRTLVADGAFEPHDAGVSEYGARIIARMNAVHMAVDLGHASDQTKLDALQLSKVTPIISHSNCRALIPNGLRATTDDCLRKLAARGGVMGITDIAFMVKSTDPVTVEDVVDHYDHVRDLVGIEHVAMGSDAGIESNDLGDPKIAQHMLDTADPRYHVHGTAEIVPGLQGRTRAYELTAALVRRGYTDDHIRLILGGNWTRVLKQIWGA
jgi:membrane dipeptidase